MNEIFSHLYFSVAVISLFVLIETILNFRKTLTLKYLILAIISSVLFWNLAEFYCLRTPYNPWLIELPRIIIPLTFINLITYLLHYKIKRNILFITAFILVLKITQLSYLTYSQAPEELFRTVSINKIKDTSLVLKIIFLIFNLSYYIFIYRKINASLRNENIYHLQLKKWATTFILVLIYCITYNILLFFLPSIFFDIQVILISLIICLTISFRPNYFNKTDFKLTINNTFNKVKQDDLSIEKFKSEFFLKNYFTKKNCSLEEFSEIMGVSNEAINLYIYEQYGLSFSDFVNKQRVELFIATIKDKKINELTIEALAEMVGFGSRPTLYRAFKKHHGGNPTDLIKAVS